MIKVKRIYDEVRKEDGFRILVDRLWPRGLSKNKAETDLWLREIAPSDKLRKWYSHDPKKWGAFLKKYKEELTGKRELLDQLRMIEAEKGAITLLFSSKEELYNNAVALKNILKESTT